MSCRYQPNYRGDAMFRSDADFRLEPCLDFTFDILDGPYVPSPVIPGLHPRDLSLALACEETLEDITISDTSPTSLYRTTDLVTNHGYKARRFNATADDETLHEVELTNVQGFNPYIIVRRSSTIQWVEAGTRLRFTPTALETGPITIEVTTLNKHEMGSFDISYRCDVELDTLTVPIDCEETITDIDFTEDESSVALLITPEGPGTFSVTLNNISGFSPALSVSAQGANDPPVIVGNTITFLLNFIPLGGVIYVIVESIDDDRGTFDATLSCPLVGNLRAISTGCIPSGYSTDPFIDPPYPFFDVSQDYDETITSFSGGSGVFGFSLVKSGSDWTMTVVVQHDTNLLTYISAPAPSPFGTWAMLFDHAETLPDHDPTSSTFCAFDVVTSFEE